MGYEMQWFETEEGVMLILFVLFLGFVFASISAIIAGRKGRGKCNWFVLSLLFGPIILVIVSVVSPSEESKYE